ncbi:MAG: tetratricopeptide repeat protein, partial [Acidobacteriota bacterium]|nr:tetratricopeptide repeat protein [Acidobacteriota bacterium]
MRTSPLLASAALILASGSAFGASKEMQEMQRDIAQLQDQLRTMQSNFDQKMASIQTLVQQALDAASKANTNVSVLSAGVSSTLDRELKQSLTPVAGLATKIDSTNNDVSELRNSVQDLNSSVNRIQQTLNDLNNAVKVMSAPAAPPPASGGSAAPAGDSAAASAAPPAEALFTSAQRDYTGGNFDLAISEYQDFIKFYPDNPNAARAQYNIGNTHYTQQKYEQAAADFDTVIGKYPDDTTSTPQAYFMKGMALKNINKTGAIQAWRTLISKYPNSDLAAQAKEQLRAIGVS